MHRAPGGSSSGPAVAGATDMAMIGVCTDTGGSARVPASVCGLAGYRPSEGVFPDDGMLKFTIADRIGVIGKTVEDVRLFSDIVSEVDLSQAKSSPKKIKTSPTALLQGFLFGIFSELDKRQVGDLAVKELVMFLETNLPEHQLDFSPRVQKMIQEGRESSADSVQIILDFIVKFAAEKSSELFSTTDFLVTPTVPIPPPTIEALSTDEGYEAISDSMFEFTILGSLLWGTAITVPNGFDNESLPVGLQFIGLAGSDRDLFAIASTIENLIAAEL